LVMVLMVGMCLLFRWLAAMTATLSVLIGGGIAGSKPLWTSFGVGALIGC